MSPKFEPFAQWAHKYTFTGSGYRRLLATAPLASPGCNNTARHSALRAPHAIPPERLTRPMAFPGEQLAGRYQLIQQIGAGGMATVWRARDLRLERLVAIKLLRPELAEDEDLARRFESEARHAASLSHPNVAPVFDTDVDGDERFIV